MRSNDSVCAFSNRFAFTKSPSQIIAEGNFGTVVYRAHQTETTTQVVVAVKCIQLSMLTPKLQDAAKREVDILKLVAHPNIVKTHDTYLVSGNEILIFTEYIRGGDLFDLLQSKQSLSEHREAKRMMKPLCSAIRYLHDEMQIVHRDVKLENILLRDAEDCSSVVLIDFGFARRCKDSAMMCRTDCGTRNYASPEVLLGRPYGKGVDVWALGVSLFMLVAGYHPFESAANSSVLFNNICNGNILYDVDDEASTFWNTQCSPQARDFVSSMLRVDVAQRPRVQQLCEHAWLCEE